jgi:hypothetical protein
MCRRLTGYLWQATKILDFLLQILEAEESPEAQAVIVTGLCKLLLAGMITEPRVSNLIMFVSKFEC